MATAYCERPIVGDKVAAAVFFVLPPLMAYANKGAVVLLVLLALGSLWDVLRARRPLPVRPLPRLVFGVLMGLLAWAASSALWAETPGLALPRSIEMAGLVTAGTVTLMMLHAWSDDERRKVALALTYGMLLLLMLVAVDITLHGVIEAALRRAFSKYPSTYFSPSRFKIAVTITGILLPPLLLWHWRNRIWWALIVLPAGLIACGVAAQSNTGILAALVSGVVLLLALAAPRAVAVMIGLLVATSFLAAPLIILRMPPPKALAEAIEMLPNSMMHRLAIWRFTSEHVAQRPLMGWGFDASREIPGGDKDIPAPIRLYGELQDAELQAMPLHPHNLMLQIWLELGFVGVLGFVALYLSVIVTAWRTPLLTAPALGMMAGALVVGAASFGAWQAWWVSAQWIFVVVCLILCPTGKKTSALNSTGFERALPGHDHF